MLPSTYSDLVAVTSFCTAQLVHSVRNLITVYFIVQPSGSGGSSLHVSLGSSSVIEQEV